MARFPADVTSIPDSRPCRSICSGKRSAPGPVAQACPVSPRARRPGGVRREHDRSLVSATMLRMSTTTWRVVEAAKGSGFPSLGGTQVGDTDGQLNSRQDQRRTKRNARRAKPRSGYRAAWTSRDLGCSRRGLGAVDGAVARPALISPLRRRRAERASGTRASAVRRKQAPHINPGSRSSWTCPSLPYCC
jgi:hypothetical protein